MKKTKRCLAQFTFYDRTGIQRFLEQKAREGWMLERIAPMFWKFRRIEPKDIHFAVTYFAKASVYDPEPTEKQKTFQAFCEYSGWKLAGINGPLQIFYNEADDPIPLETDALMEVRAIHASAKKNFLPSYFLLLFVALMQLATHIGQLTTFPLTYLSQDTTLFNWFCTGILLTMCLQEIGGYFLWHRKAKRAAEENGEFVATKGHRKFQLTLVGLLVAALVLLLFSLELRFAVTMAVCIAGVFLLVYLILGIKELMKRMKASRGTNMAVTIGACVVLSIVITGGLTYGMVRLIQSDIWESEESPDTYEAYGKTWEIHHDEMPLTVADLLDTDYEGYSCEVYERSSLLLTEYIATQMGRVGDMEPGIHYSIYTVRLPLLYKTCLNALLEDDYGSSEDVYGNVYYYGFIKMDSAPWGADAAYQMRNGTDSPNQFLVCYDNRIVNLVTDWEMTAEQMATVGQLLGNAG